LFRPELSLFVKGEPVTLDNLDERMRNMVEKARAKKKAAGSAEPPAPVSVVLQFPLPFGEQSRAVSNPMARCALFAPVKERAHYKEYTLVGEVDGLRVEMKGEQFNQDDHDTLLQLVKMALHKPYGVDVYQSVNAVLGGLNRHTRQEQRKQLFAQVERLVAGTLRITRAGEQSYHGHIIDDCSTPQDQQTEPQHRRFLTYRLNPKFAAFYKKASFTVINFSQRVKLKGRGSELAKWLQLFIESHAEQYPHKVETFRDQSGSTVKDLKSFRQILRQALDLLKGAGIINNWKIDPKSDVVTINRTPSPAQIRHIIKKATKKGKPKK
jgi:hypothetical protein